VSAFHCTCGYAIDDPDCLADHFRDVFTPDDDTDSGGCVHVELTDDYVKLAANPAREYVCSCGLAADDGIEFDDHFLMAFATPDAIGTDGRRHSLMDPATPDRWQVP
jgi:hypothetical protein